MPARSAGGDRCHAAEVDDRLWTRGARVEGHRARVVGRESDARVSCSCGQPFAAQTSAWSACHALVLHLDAAVRDGARVLTGGEDGDDGSAGVREPRRPFPPDGSGAVGLDLG